MAKIDSLKARYDQFIMQNLKGRKKKYLIAILSIISGLILVFGMLQPFIIIHDLSSKNWIGIDSVRFYVTDVPNGQTQQVIGYLYRTGEAVGYGIDAFNPEPGSAPAIVMLHGWMAGIGKENVERFCVELARRNFVVLAIDLPGMGRTIGTMPSIFPHVDLEPYIIKGAIEYLKTLPYVNASAIGLAGHSYGGAAAALSTGILGDLVNATVIMGGLTNLTDWLIAENGLLSKFNIDFEVTSEAITLTSVNGKPIQPKDIEDLLDIFLLFRGNIDLIKETVIPGTTSINRTLLGKLDAVNYLKDARPDSIMFIDPILDNTFANTNQSGQGFLASTNGAIYYPVTAHLSMDDNASAYWAMINFFKERLNGTVLDPKPTIYETYAQETDALGFNYDVFKVDTNSIEQMVLVIILAFVPITYIINIIMISKRFETERANKEYSEEEKRIRFKGANFKKVILGLILQIFLAGLILWIFGSGLDNYNMLIDLIPLYMIAFYFTLIFVQDEAEIKKIIGMPQDKPLINYDYFKIKDANRTKLYRKSILIALIIISGTALLVGLIIPKSIPSQMPFDSMIMAMWLFGITLIVTACLYIRKLIRESNNQVGWSGFGMDRYSLMKGLACGVSSGLGLLIIYTIVVALVRFPFNIGFSTWYFPFVLLGMIASAVGLFLWTEVILRKFLYVGSDVKSKVKAWFISSGIGLGMTILSGLLISIKLMDFGIWVDLYIPGIFALVWGAMYMIARFVELISSETGVLSSTFYIPILAVTFFAFFLKF